MKKIDVKMLKIAILQASPAPEHIVTPEYTKKLYALKVGDKVTRVFAGIQIEVVIGEVTDTTIKVGDEYLSWEDGWTFSRITGVELDYTIDSKLSGKVISFIKLD